MFDVLQQLILKFIQFWIDLSKNNCIRIVEKGQEVTKKNGREGNKKIKRVRDISLWKFYHTDE